MYNILFIEDNTSLVDSIIEYLGSQKYYIIHEQRGELGLKLLKRSQFDLLILDLGLPDINGYSVLNRIRNLEYNLPVLVLSSNSDVDTICKLLNAGADAYISKPFSMRELHSRIDALLSRPPRTVNEVLSISGLLLDKNHYSIIKDNKVVQLRKKEMEILEYLIKHPNQVISRDQLLTNLWGENTEPYGSTIDVHISNIRKKVFQNFNTQVITTVHGFGYKIKEGK